MKTALWLKSLFAGFVCNEEYVRNIEIHEVRNSNMSSSCYLCGRVKMWKIREERLGRRRLRRSENERKDVAPAAMFVFDKQ